MATKNIRGTNLNDTLLGSAGADRITASGGDDVIFAGAGADTVYAGTGNDFVDGGDDNDTLYGQQGDDSLLGGAGADVLDGGEGNDRLEGGSGDDRLLGASGNDLLIGGDGDDYLNGGSGVDTLLGGAGSDILIGSSGEDTVDGGSGDDTIVLSNDVAFDKIQGGEGFDVIVGSEFLRGSEIRADNLRLTNFSSANGIEKIDLGGGNNVIRSGTEGASLDFSATELVNVARIEGSGNADLITGSAGRDTIWGNGGADTLFGGAGDDVMGGEQGNDRLDGGDGIDIARFAGSSSRYHWKLEADGSVTVADKRGAKIEGTDVLTNFEFLQFDDKLVDLRGLGNRGPEARADQGISLEDGGSATGNVLANDRDADGDRLSVVDAGTRTGLFGTLVLGADGAFSYQLDNTLTSVQALGVGESATETFTYQVSDGRGGLATSEIVITVAGSNDGPVANASNEQVGEDGVALVGGNVLENSSDIDGDTLSVVDPGTRAGTYGVFSLAADGSYSYELTAGGAAYKSLGDGESAIERFAFSISDGQGGTATSYVDIEVFGANAGPVAEALAASGQEDGTISGALQATDEDGDALSFALADGGAPAHGTVTINADGSFVYVPDANYSGADSFVYVVSDGQGGSTSEIVTLDVAALVDAPTLAVSAVAPSFVSTESRANTTVRDDQYESAVAVLSGGGYVVVWADELQDGSEAGIYARRYDATGHPIGLEFRVNTVADGDQFGASVTALSDGGFVVAWRSLEALDLDTDDYGVTAVKMQRYDANGAAVGGEFVVNSTQMESGMISYPYVATLADGGFVAVWGGDETTPGHSMTHVGRRFDSSGTPVGADFVISANHDFASSELSVAALSDGGFIVNWKEHATNGTYSVLGQRYDAAGTALGGAFQINTSALTYETTYGGTSNNNIAGLADGGFVATWAGFDAAGSRGVFAQRYDAAGLRVGSETLVNTTTSGHQEAPSVAALAGGGYVVTWESSDQVGSGSLAVVAQIFDAAGNRVGGEIVNAAPGSYQAIPEVAALSDGGFVITWSGAASNGYYDTYVQRYDAAGNRAEISEYRENVAVPLTISAASADLDGSESLVVSISGLPSGSSLSAGTQNADRSWSLAANQLTGLEFRPPANYTGHVELTVVATSTEISTGASASTVATLAFDVSDAQGLYGAGGAETLTGTSGVDNLFGLGGNDVLLGKGGADTLVGGTGSDTMTGGTGADCFVFDSLSGVDAVTDFVKGATGDILDIRGVLTGYVAGSSTLADFVQVATEGSNTVVRIDQNGAADGAQYVDLVLLQGVTGVTLDELVQFGNIRAS